MITHVTYAHKKKPDGQRFRQSASVALPKWACNLQFEFARPAIRRWEMLVVVIV